MKIIAVDTNKQFRFKPDSALLLKNRPLFCPDYVKALHAKIELVVKINRLGKYIQEKFASSYYDEVGFAIDFYDKESLYTLIQEGFPWERATCFDGSFALSEFVKISEIRTNAHIGVHVETQNSTPPQLPSQTFAIDPILQQIPSIVADLSVCMTLKIGDYIAIELDELKGAPFAINSVLRLSLDDREMLSVVVK